MTTVVLAFLVMVALLAAMAIGVILGCKPISGSCGGMKALGLDVECEICGGNPELCDSTADEVPNMRALLPAESLQRPANRLRPKFYSIDRVDESTASLNWHW